MLKLSPHLTHKANLKHTRYGWLRLTPAYSVHLVSDLLEDCYTPDAVVLDPFCGTGTTALVCAERGITADTTDINPFLLWLTIAKTRDYTPDIVEEFRNRAEDVESATAEVAAATEWLPPLHQIEKWWDERTLHALGRAFCRIQSLDETVSPLARDLLRITFCRVLIERANVSFGHQSMSFKQGENAPSLFDDSSALTDAWARASGDIAQAAQSPLRNTARALSLDARNLTQGLPIEHYTHVITSPPYPNRMSYIRELRPYMFWLGYLRDGREAGELDWQAIGGTWGCATSNVGKWIPPVSRSVPFEEFTPILDRIAEHSPLLSRYVHKYFYDMTDHIEQLFAVMRSGGVAHYIVGNSKFYEVLLPVEEIFAALFRATGFEAVVVRPIRKRTSKKELFEYVVSARKP